MTGQYDNNPSQNWPRHRGERCRLLYSSGTDLDGTIDLRTLLPARSSYGILSGDHRCLDAHGLLATTLAPQRKPYLTTSSSANGAIHHRKTKRLLTGHQTKPRMVAAPKSSLSTNILLAMKVGIKLSSAGPYFRKIGNTYYMREWEH
jgi:hypothetical protein